METFGARLVAAMHERWPLCVGIDPHPDLLTAWGLPDSPDGLAAFSGTVVEALGEQVAVLKPQVAFFERFGSAGIAVLESVLKQARGAGALVLLDVKRADIETTAVAYADAYLNPTSPLFADAVTVNPYPGCEALAPFLDRAGGCGVFVLALTSNPGGRTLQQARTGSGRTVAQTVIDEVASANAGQRPIGSVGVVIGATTGPAGHDLSRLGGPVLAPGLGAQGAQASDLVDLVASLDGVVLPSYSRSVLRRGPSVTELRAEVADIGRQCRQVLRIPPV